jgi:hypothetical protein
MDAKIDAKLRQLDAELEQLLKTLLKYPHEKLAQQPGPGRWSVYEVMQHLMLAEKGGHNYLSKKALSMKLPPKLGLGSWFRRTLTKFYLNTNIKFKAPAGAAEAAFKPIASFAQISGEWQQNRSNMRKLLESLPPGWEKVQAYKHPIGGRMGLLGMLDFWEAHLRRHKKQIERTLVELGVK